VIAYDATDRNSLYSFVDRLHNLQPDIRNLLNIYLISQNLMIPTGAAGLCIRFLRLVTSAVFFRKTLWVLFERNPAISIGSITATVQHLLHGRDTEDKDSVGGFSQRELDLIAAFLDLTEEKFATPAEAA
jgi:hypothetical protein